jgi:hypothetical protein
VGMLWTRNLVQRLLVFAEVGLWVGIVSRIIGICGAYADTGVEGLVISTMVLWLLILASRIRGRVISVIL